MDELIAQRFAELMEKADVVAKTSTRGCVDTKLANAWVVSALNILRRTFGESSPHYEHLNALYIRLQHGSHVNDFRACAGVLLGAKEDFEGGFLFSVRALVRAEVLSDDVLKLAVELLQGGQKDLACMLARVALESTLKELCTCEGIPHGKIDKMNSELCKAGIYNMGMQKLITTWAHWGNKAAHGEWDEYTSADVDDLLKGVTRFIADYLR